MPKIQSWEVSDAFWERVEPLIPLPEREPGKTYKHRPGGGRKPMPARRILRPSCRYCVLDANGGPPRRVLEAPAPSTPISCVGYVPASLCPFSPKPSP